MFGSRWCSGYSFCFECHFKTKLAGRDPSDFKTTENVLYLFFFFLQYDLRDYNIAIICAHSYRRLFEGTRAF